MHKCGPTKIVDISEYEMILDTYIRWEHMYVNWAPIHVWHIYVLKKLIFEIEYESYILHVRSRITDGSYSMTSKSSYYYRERIPSKKPALL